MGRCEHRPSSATGNYLISIYLLQLGNSLLALGTHMFSVLGSPGIRPESIAWLRNVAEGIIENLKLSRSLKLPSRCEDQKACQDLNYALHIPSTFTNLRLQS